MGSFSAPKAPAPSAAEVALQNDQTAQIAQQNATQNTLLKTLLRQRAGIRSFIGGPVRPGPGDSTGAVSTGNVSGASTTSTSGGASSPIDLSALKQGNPNWPWPG